MFKKLCTIVGALVICFFAVYGLFFFFLVCLKYHEYRSQSSKTTQNSVTQSGLTFEKLGLSRDDVVMVQLENKATGFQISEDNSGTHVITMVSSDIPSSDSYSMEDNGFSSHLFDLMEIEHLYVTPIEEGSYPNVIVVRTKEGNSTFDTRYRLDTIINLKEIKDYINSLIIGWTEKYGQL